MGGNTRTFTGRFINIITRIAGAVNWIDVTILTCLASFGLFILLSINQTFFAQQLIYFGIALVLLVVAASLDAGLVLWAAPFLYGVSIILLLLSYLGPTIRGATRWIMIGGAQLQPSELVKPLLLLSFSWALTRFPPKTIRAIVLHGLLFLIPFFIVFKQPDLGTGLVYAAAWLSMMIASGFQLRWVVVLSLMAVLALPVGWRGLHDYQQARIITFLNPSLDPKGAGYNALQSMIAVGSGQLFGRGLGRGTQSQLRFLPEHHTDFIFATLVEELGFAGGIMLLVGYALLLWRIISPLLRGQVRQMLPFVYSVGLCTMLLTQIFINAGMNMGIIPITGITLPLVSYGGSSLLSITISFGLIWLLRRSMLQ